MPVALDLEARTARAVQVEPAVFRDVAAEAVRGCMDALELGAQRLGAAKGPRHGQLFLLAHLFVLRTQIAPFDVSFMVTERSLDLSRWRDTLVSLWRHPRLSFASLSPAAIIEFLTATAPSIRRKEIDQRQVRPHRSPRGFWKWWV